jgi:hypothetical protein
MGFILQLSISVRKSIVIFSLVIRKELLTKKEEIVQVNLSIREAIVD